MSDASPPLGTGPLAKREARLAWGLLFPTIAAVALVVVLPLLAIFWISVKPVELGDLRPPEVVLREDIRGDSEAVGDEANIRYRLRNSSQEQPITGVTLADRLPEGLRVVDLDERCALDGRALLCDLGDWAPGFRENLMIPVVVEQAYLDNGLRPQDSEAVGDEANIRYRLRNSSQEQPITG
ncbi:MAG: sugar ABC transporter permease, partial [Pseudomonadota bacterium]